MTDRGFLIVAVNNSTVDYIQCARTLCSSIKRVMPDEAVALLTDTLVPPGEFDCVLQLPYGDQTSNLEWKLDNDWQVYSASPFKYTIKLEADMYLPRSIDQWWHVLTKRDMVISTTIRDYKNNISRCREYRKTFDINHLPDVYNAITYFKKGDLAEEFYGWVEEIFKNWRQYRLLLRGPTDDYATTDIVYALATIFMGVENCTLPKFNEMSMIHMKKYIIGSVGNNWTSELLWEVLPHCIRIETIPQLYPLHYHIKDFAEIINREISEW